MGEVGLGPGSGGRCTALARRGAKLLSARGAAEDLVKIAATPPVPSIPVPVGRLARYRAGSSFHL